MTDQRRQFVALYHTGHYTKTHLCDLFGISRPTGDTWLARYEASNSAWAEDRSHAPHTCPHATPSTVVEAVTALRLAHPTWGPKKLRAHLQATRPDLRCPAASTIGRVLQGAELVPALTRQRAPAAAPSPPLTPPDTPNRVWCADLKGWFRLGNRQRCDPLTVTDGYSRYLLACDAYCQPTSQELITTFTRLFTEYGLPEVIRTDNGTPFATTAVSGLSRVSIWWIKLGIRPERIAPGRPQQNGRHERMHRTLGGETQPAADLPAQQAVFETFRAEYNTVRPHEALAQRPPATCYTRSPRALPAVVPPVTYPLRLAVRTVRADGYVKWDGQLVFLSEALIGEDVGWEPLDARLWRVYFAHLPLGVWDTHTGRWLGRKQAQALGRAQPTAGPPAGPDAPQGFSA